MCKCVSVSVSVCVCVCVCVCVYGVLCVWVHVTIPTGPLTHVHEHVLPTNVQQVELCTALFWGYRMPSSAQ